MIELTLSQSRQVCCGIPLPGGTSFAGAEPRLTLGRSQRAFRSLSIPCGGVTGSDEEMIFLDDVLVQHAGWLRQNTALSIRTDLRPTYVVGDAATLNRAVAALIDHARCNAASVIELLVYRRDAEAIITVRDDGPHIAVADGGRMSSAAHEEPAAAPWAPERDPRLALAAGIIATHGGTLDVAEDSACVNAVSVRLPSTRQSLRNSAAPSGISGGE